MDGGGGVKSEISKQQGKPIQTQEQERGGRWRQNESEATAVLAVSFYGSNWSAIGKQMPSRCVYFTGELQHLVLLVT